MKEFREQIYFAVQLVSKKVIAKEYIQKRQKVKTNIINVQDASKNINTKMVITNANFYMILAIKRITRTFIASNVQNRT
jgi:hypothetical protein